MCYPLLNIYHRNILTTVILHNCISPLCLHYVTQRYVNKKHYTAKPLRTKKTKNSVHFACAFHPEHKCWSMVSINCSLTKSNVNLKKKKNSLKRKRVKTIWVACRIKIFSCCSFCFVWENQKTKTKRHLLPWALTIDLAGKVIGNPKQLAKKKEQFPSSEGTIPILLQACYNSSNIHKRLQCSWFI